MDNDEMLVLIKGMFEKSMDSMERKFNEKIEEVKRHTGTIVEGLQSDMKAVAEGHSVVDRKIDGLKEDLVETKQDLKEEINDIKKDITGLKKDMAIVKDYVIGVDAKLNEHEIIFERVK